MNTKKSDTSSSKDKASSKRTDAKDSQPTSEKGGAQSKVMPTKDKILWAGSSIGRSVNFRKLEKISGKFIRTRKAYTALKENYARFPDDNLKDVVRKELKKSKYMSICVFLPQGPLKLLRVILRT